MTTIHDFTCDRLTGKAEELADYKGQVVLVVNTASKCGFTPQYEGLEDLYRTYKHRGFSVLGFPCNQFGNQEQGEGDEIGEFCQINYGVSFPMFSKIKVNGPEADPLYKFIKREAKGVMGTANVKWNFTKFLVDQKGNVVKRFGSRDTPSSIASHIEALL